jgi:iron complex transport system substrate-binding protein
LFIPAEQATAQAAKEENISIQDATGRIVEVRLPVKKLVVLTSDALEIIRALKGEDLVAGVYSDISRDSQFWPELKDKPKVGNWKGLNYELVAELNPDIVLCYSQRPGRDMERKLEPFGVKVVRLDFFRLGTLEKEVAVLGRILKKEKEAMDLIAWYRKKLELIQKGLKNISDQPDVYIEGDSKYHTAGPGSGGHEMCVLAGGHNIASDLSIPYPEITPEWILMNDPDIIVKTTTKSTCGTSYSMADAIPLKRIRDRVMARPAWENIRAVKDNKVFVMANEIWIGPRAIIGAGYMAKWFYPDAFKELDPKKFHKEYLEKFQGIEYRGVYVWANEN